jgi:hypothetical protein
MTAVTTDDLRQLSADITATFNDHQVKHTNLDSQLHQVEPALQQLINRLVILESKVADGLCAGRGQELRHKSCQGQHAEGVSRRQKQVLHLLPPGARAGGGSDG